MKAIASIPGYSCAAESVRRSPVTLADLELMKKSVSFNDEDAAYLRLSQDVLKDQIEEVLNVWIGFVGSNPHLLATFVSKSSGQPDSGYLEAVRKRFGQWILETARAEYDQNWLDYQHEIGLRHHRTKKNSTDRANASGIVPFRDLVLLVFPITFTLKPFLAKKGHSADEVGKMHASWVKSCLLQVTLWSYPYVKDGDF